MNNKTKTNLLVIFLSMLLLSFILMYSMMYSIYQLDATATDYVSIKETMTNQLGIILWLLLTSLGLTLTTVYIPVND